MEEGIRLGVCVLNIGIIDYFCNVSIFKKEQDKCSLWACRDLLQGQGNTFSKVALFTLICNCWHFLSSLLLSFVLGVGTAQRVEGVCPCVGCWKQSMMNTFSQL